LPSGTVAFLFSDIEGSTRLWQEYPQQMKATLLRHDEILKATIEANGGYVFKTVGDAFHATFDKAIDGLVGALHAQLAIGAETWDPRTPIKVRMALHTGEAVERDNDYFGATLNRSARLESIGYGGQILVSLVCAELVRDMLPDDVSLKEMGRRRLKDLTRPEEVYQ
jgi:class 3 adenylate cyclase